MKLSNYSGYVLSSYKNTCKSDKNELNVNKSDVNVDSYKNKIFTRGLVTAKYNNF